MTPTEEQAYAEGRRSTYRSLLGECARELGGEDRKLAAVLAEVEAARVALRRLCADHGDLEWDDRLHLADVIEKHLARHLDARAEKAAGRERARIVKQVRHWVANGRDGMPDDPEGIGDWIATEIEESGDE